MNRTSRRCLIAVMLGFCLSVNLSGQTVEWDTVKSDVDLYVPGGNPAPHSVGLIVSNHGEIGHAGLGGVNLDYTASGLETGTDPRYSVYLYSGSVYAIVAEDSEGNGAVLTQSYADLDVDEFSWRPMGDPMTGGQNCNYFGCYDSVYTGRMRSREDKIMWERTFYAPRMDHSPDDAYNFVVCRNKIYAADGISHDHVTLGSVCDWNVPATTPNLNTNAAIQIFECSGYTWTYADDPVCDAQSSGSGYRGGAEMFAFGSTAEHINSDPCSFYGRTGYGYAPLTQKMLVDTSLARDGAPLTPSQPDAEAWWDEIAAHPCENSNPEWMDQAVWLTFAHDITLASTDTLYYWTTLASAHCGTWSHVEAPRGYTQFCFQGVITDCWGGNDCCEGRVGDANDSNPANDEPTIADIAAIIDMKFVSGVDVDCMYEADVNQSYFIDNYYPSSEQVTIADIAILIDYLFVEGPSLHGLRYCACMDFFHTFEW